MIPVGPEENIFTAINRDYVIHHLCRDIEPLLLALYT
nr:MAG TPA_asm: hypothetical protein [Caudoviricetes sp.]